MAINETFTTIPNEILDLLPNAIFIINKDKIITGWNKKASDITGISSDKIMGQKCDILFNGQCNKGCIFSEKDNVDHKKKYLIRKKNGESIYIKKAYNLIKDKHNNITSCIESFEDITHQKNKEILLSEIEEKKIIQKHLKQKNEDFSILVGLLDLSLNPKINLSKIIQVISEDIKNVFNCLGVSISLYDDETGTLNMENLVFPSKILNKVIKLVGMDINKLLSKLSINTIECLYIPKSRT